MDLLITTLLIVVLFALLGSGVWIGLALVGSAASASAGEAGSGTVIGRLT